MIINIKNKNQFVTDYLRPISALTEAIIIKSKNNKLECITNNEQGLIVYASYNLEVENNLILNKPNVRKLEKIKSIGTFIKREDGYKVTAPEGFVAVDRIQNKALKLVDRLEFSKANFTVAKDWVKG